jgi:hypothetical protein
VQWNNERTAEIEASAKEVAEKRGRCAREALDGNTQSGRRPGVGTVAKFCERQADSDALELKRLRKSYDDQLPQQQAMMDDAVVRLNAELQKISDTQEKKDGFLGRIFQAFVVAEAMSRDQPGMTFAFLMVDFLIIVIQVIPFGAKANHDFDSYDEAFAKDMGWTERDAKKIQDAIDAQRAAEALADAEEARRRAKLSKAAEDAGKIAEEEKKVQGLEMARLQRDLELARKQLELQQVRDQIRNGSGESVKEHTGMWPFSRRKAK